MMVLLVALVTGMLVVAESQVSDTAHLSKYDKFITPNLKMKQPSMILSDKPFDSARGQSLLSTKDVNSPQIVDGNTTPISLYAIGAGLLSLATMLGLRIRRGLQPATALASSSAQGSKEDMMEMGIGSLLGFDPLDFSRGISDSRGSEANAKQMREGELNHGRMAMLAASERISPLQLDLANAQEQLLTTRQYLVSAMSVMTASLSAPAFAATESMTNESPLVLIVPINIALITMVTLVGASAFNFGSLGGNKGAAPKKAAAPKKGAFGGFGGGGARSSGPQVAKGGNTVSTIQVPQIFTTAFGDPDRIANRQARAEAEKAESQAQLIPVPARFQFAFGRPEVLQERRAERLAKWQWSGEFISKARPDKGNYGAGDFFDDGLTKLEREQISGGREAYLTGAAKLRYKRLTGQI
jgi:hypothetical protein